MYSTNMSRLYCRIFRYGQRWTKKIGENFVQTRCASHFNLSEPSGPTIKTDIPGPVSNQLLQELDAIQNSESVQFFTDYEQSHGNYVRDVDGNTLLDVHTHFASLPLGYNHPVMLEALRNPENTAAFINRPALGSYPPKDWSRRLKSTLLSVAPAGLTEVYTMSCGSCANEYSQKAAFIEYQRKRRKGNPPSKEELTSCLMNLPPGCPPLTILSFKGSNHGRTMGSLATTHAMWRYKLDFPQPDWPVATFPCLRYPLQEFERENREEENKCLEEVRDVIDKYNSKGAPVAGIVVEPIQAEGGDNYATAHFFQGLQDITTEMDIALVLDEVQTGVGTTGRFWAYEHFDMKQPPDIVAFSKKMMTGGYYYKANYRADGPFRIFNTWLGDPGKIVFLEAVLKYMKANDLIHNVQSTGQYILEKLLQIQSQHPGLFSKARGIGFFLAVDLPDAGIRDKAVAILRNKGVNSSGCGDRTLRFRPSLIFEKHHSDILLDAVSSMANALKK